MLSPPPCILKITKLGNLSGKGSIKVVEISLVKEK